MISPPPVSTETVADLTIEEAAYLTPLLKNVNSEELAWEIAKEKIFASVVWSPGSISTLTAAGCLVEVGADGGFSFHSPNPGTFYTEATVTFNDAMGMPQTLTNTFEFVVTGRFVPVALSFTVTTDDYTAPETP